jgi:hypothetical protein
MKGRVTDPGEAKIGMCLGNVRALFPALALAFSLFDWTYDDHPGKSNDLFKFIIRCSLMVLMKFYLCY